MKIATTTGDFGFYCKTDEERIREPQLFMQRHIEALMYDTAKWMLESYGVFENQTF